GRSSKAPDRWPSPRTLRPSSTVRSTPASTPTRAGRRVGTSIRTSPGACATGTRVTIGSGARRRRRPRRRSRLTGATPGGGAEEREGAVGDQVGGLVGDEVAAALDQFHPHVVGVALPAGEHLGTQGGVVGAVEVERRHGEALAHVTAAHHLRLLA